MSKRQIENNYSTRILIPIEFGTDGLLCFRIKIQPQNSMSHATIISEKPLIPGLFQIAGRVHDIRSASMLKNGMALDRTPLSEMMLDPKKFEAVLKGIARKKKFSTRRISASHFEKNLV
jgi:hypothetical protein